MHARRRELLIGIAFLAFAIAALALWIPNDIESGIIEKVRRREKMGDALLPTAIAVAMAIVALAHLLRSWLGRPSDDGPEQGGPSLRYALPSLAVLACAFTLMVWTGPALVWLMSSLGEPIGTYRELRDTVPYKYAGFVIGGSVLVAGLIATIEGRLRLRAVGVAMLATLALIGAYDLPFEDLLLPPNGDQ